MDVEAQEDGVMAKILVPTGSKGVAVGTRIAVLAEEGDDLAALEIPAEEKKGSAPAPENLEELKEEIPPMPAKQLRSTTEEKPAQLNNARPTHPSPSVLSLLRANSLSTADSASIPGTGPKGRLLKGDILAHLGAIATATPGNLAARISKLGKLDLSNIKVAAPKPKPAPAAATTPPPPPPPTVVYTTVDFSPLGRLTHRLPLSTLISRATTLANASLPPVPRVPSQDELFNDLLDIPNPPRRATPGTFAPKFTPARTSASAVQVSKPSLDIFDELVGSAGGVQSVRKLAGPREGIVATGENVLTLEVPKWEEARAKVFLGRFKKVVEESTEELVR